MTILYYVFSILDHKHMLNFLIIMNNNNTHRYFIRNADSYFFYVYNAEIIFILENIKSLHNNSKIRDLIRVFECGL